MGSEGVIVAIGLVIAMVIIAVAVADFIVTADEIRVSTDYGVLDAKKTRVAS